MTWSACHDHWGFDVIRSEIVIPPVVISLGRNQGRMNEDLY